MNSENKAISRLTDVNSKVSCHYFVQNSGKIILMVPEKFTAWHAGKSAWGKHKSLNKYSIGIEIQNPGHNNNYKTFNKKQIRSVIKLCSYVKKKYKIKKENVVGHSDISHDRKKDPGEKFPWRILGKLKISIWHNLDEFKLKKMRKLKIEKVDRNEFIKNLNKIGYNFDKNPNKYYKPTIAFQRRFRSHLINGIVDKECLEISRKLVKN